MKSHFKEFFILSLLVIATLSKKTPNDPTTSEQSNNPIPESNISSQNEIGSKSLSTWYTIFGYVLIVLGPVGKIIACYQGYKEKSVLMWNFITVFWEAFFYAVYLGYFYHYKLSFLVCYEYMIEFMLLIILLGQIIYYSRFDKMNEFSKVQILNKTFDSSPKNNLGFRYVEYYLFFVIFGVYVYFELFPEFVHEQLINQATIANIYPIASRIISIIKKKAFEPIILFTHGFGTFFCLGRLQLCRSQIDGSFFSLYLAYYLELILTAILCLQYFKWGKEPIDNLQTENNVLKQQLLENDKNKKLN